MSSQLSSLFDQLAVFHPPTGLARFSHLMEIASLKFIDSYVTVLVEFKPIDFLFLFTA